MMQKQALDNYRVVFVTTSLDRGGAEKMLVKFTVELQKVYEKVIIVNLRDNNAFEAELIQNGVIVHQIGLNQPLFGLPKSILIFWKIWRSNPTHFIGWMYHGNLVATFIWVLCGCRHKLIWNIRQSLRTLIHDKIFTRLIIKFCAALSRYPNGIIYNSDEARTSHQQYGYCCAKSSVVRNFVYRPTYREEYENDIPASINQLKKNGLMFGMVGRFHPSKGFSTLAHAWTKIDKPTTTFGLVMVGKGVQEKQAIFAEFLGPEGMQNVAFVEEIKNVASIYEAIDCLLLCSDAEGMPNALIEAMAYRVPIISSKVGDIDVLFPEKHWLFEPGDSEKLARLCERFIELNDAERRLIGDVNFRHALNNFDPDTALKAYISLLD